MMYPQQGKKAGGKGAGGKGAGANANLPGMEAKLAETAWAFYEKILHLDITMPQLNQEWTKIAGLRTNILGAYGIVTPLATTSPSLNVTAPHAGTVAGEAPEGSENWKGKLQQLVSKRIGKSMVKGEIVFQVADAPSGGYIASCSSAHLSAEYTGEAHPSKKGAESEAAKAALAQEFPKEFGVATGNVLAPKGQKRKADALEAKVLVPKGQLCESMMLLLGRTLTKTDLVFETTSTGENMFASILTIPEYDAKAVFRSGQQESKKAAENTVCEMALKRWAMKITKLETEHKAKKDEVKKQKLEALKTATKEKKEAKQALIAQ